MSGWHGAWALAAALGVVACPSSPSSSTATSSDAGDAGVAGEGDAAADASDASMVANDASGGDAGNDASHASDAGGGDAGGGGWWRPGTGVLPWQWELDHEIATSSASDMGTGDTTPSGAAALPPSVYDIDGFDNTAADVAALHTLGKRVIAYIEVGAAESYRPDYAQFPAADLGQAVSGYPGEKYLNIDDPAVATVIRARIAMCAQKGFDAIEPDIDDSYTDTTGFTITESDEIAYLTKLSDYAHSLGLAWGLKNGGDGGDPATFVPGVLPHVDFAVVEEPYFLKTIADFEPLFDQAGKAMFVAEYTNDTTSASSFCPQALSDHVNAALFDVALDGKVRDPCQ